MQSDAPATSARVRCSAIIVNTNEGAVLFECLDRLDRAGRPDETIVVDNASTDRSPERLERDYPWVRLIRAASNLGYAGANDLGASNGLSARSLADRSTRRRLFRLQPLAGELQTR